MAEQIIQEEPPPAYTEYEIATSPTAVPELKSPTVQYNPVTSPTTLQYNPASYPPPPPKGGAFASNTYPPPGIQPNPQSPTSVNLRYNYIPPPPPQLATVSGGYPPEKQRPVSTTFENTPYIQQPQAQSQYAPRPQHHPDQLSADLKGLSLNTHYTQPNIAPSPNRPAPPPHLYSTPYVPPQHTVVQQQTTFTTPQFEPPPAEIKVQPYYPPPMSTASTGLAPPVAPPRPLSAPPVETLQFQPQQQVAHAPIYQTQAPAAGPSIPQPPIQQPFAQPPEDEKHNSFGKRFVGNMFVTRLARSSIQTVSSTAQLPFYLSPWGDNNPVTLPNVRKRDIAFMGVAHFGLDALAPSAMELGGEIAKTTAAWTAEAAADHGVQKLQGQKMPTVTRTGASVSTMEVRIRHKLIGEDAIVSLTGLRPAPDYTNCSKGWFCPYLYASGRATRLERKQDFAIAKMFGPGLKADASLAPMILTCLERNNPGSITALCDWRSPSATRPHFGRLAIFFLGISPYRSNYAWSQSRIPNEARLRFHALDGISAIVIPTQARAPTCMWHAKPLQVIWEQAGGGVQQSVNDASEVLEHALRDVIDMTGFGNPAYNQPGVWEATVNQSLVGMFQAAQTLKGASGGLGRILDIGRTGLVMFRY